MQFEATLSLPLSQCMCVCVCKLRLAVRQAWLADRQTVGQTGTHDGSLRQGKKEITVPHSVGKSATEMSMCICVCVSV